MIVKKSKATKNIKKVSNPEGRPRKDIDYAIVERMCKIHCTGQEIADMLEISYDTLERAIKRDHKLSFADYYARKSASGKMSLRRAQYTAAIGIPVLNERGNVINWVVKPDSKMQAHLGKAWLGQDSDAPSAHAAAIIILPDNGGQYD